MGHFLLPQIHTTDIEPLHSPVSVRVNLYDRVIFIFYRQASSVFLVLIALLEMLGCTYSCTIGLKADDSTPPLLPQPVTSLVSEQAICWDWLPFRHAAFSLWLTHLQRGVTATV